MFGSDTEQQGDDGAAASGDDDAGEPGAGADPREAQKGDTLQGGLRVERRLGAVLVRRTTRKLALTQMGEVYLRHCQAMIAEAQAAQEAIERAHAEPQGLVRVSCPTAMVQAVLSPILGEAEKPVSLRTRSGFIETRALIAGGSDILLVETIFDSLNAKAALFTIEEVFADRGIRLPLMISGTITDASGRTLSGQTTEAFYHSLRHVQPLTFGLNCALGPDLLRPYVAEMARVAECFVSVHANAGLPNDLGAYDELPEETAALVRDWALDGQVNILGGCCGSTPAHIAAIAKAVEGLPARQPKAPPVATRLAGLEPMILAA